MVFYQNILIPWQPHKNIIVCFLNGLFLQNYWVDMLAICSKAEIKSESLNSHLFYFSETPTSLWFFSQKIWQCVIHAYSMSKITSIFGISEGGWGWAMWCNPNAENIVCCYLLLMKCSKILVVQMTTANNPAHSNCNKQ